MTFVTVAQYGLERSAFNRVAGGSNPPRDTKCLIEWYIKGLFYMV